MASGWVYIMTNHPNGVLYTGVTSNIGRRAYEHREGLVPGFTKRYGLKRLVYMEFHERIADAIHVALQPGAHESRSSWPGLSRPSTL
jgi:putative endonuclease